MTNPIVTKAMLIAGAEVRRSQRLARYQNEAVASDQSIDEEESRDIYLAMSKASGPKVGWQPIENAPKDGTPLILFARAVTATASAPVTGWCIDGEWIECCFAPNSPVGLVPSHWMPRPDFPTDSLGDAP